MMSDFGDGAGLDASTVLYEHSSQTDDVQILVHVLLNHFRVKWVKEISNMRLRCLNKFIIIS